ncbi:MAG: HK97 gp10 family phage protein [Oscillospiraceae bacterium]|nr:HK97 gp10 family phage protein [Oscillospiraceae bacterium]
MANESMTLRGFDDLEHDLLNMAARVESDTTVSAALKAGAKPIQDQMEHNASDVLIHVQSGATRKGISTRKKGRKRITIGVHRKDFNPPPKAKGHYYPGYVEYGHGGPAPAPLHPFVRPAFDSQQDNAYKEMKTVLKQATKP